MDFCYNKTTVLCCRSEKMCKIYQFLLLLTCLTTVVKTQSLIPQIVSPSQNLPTSNSLLGNSGNILPTVILPYWMGTAENWSPYNTGLLNSGSALGINGLNGLNNGICPPGCLRCAVCFPRNSGACGSQCMGCSNCANQFMPNNLPNMFPSINNLNFGLLGGSQGLVPLVQGTGSFSPINQASVPYCTPNCGASCNNCIPTGYQCY